MFWRFEEKMADLENDVQLASANKETLF
ncbi:hypothetical protein LINPERHAP1_LOCUS23323 [Linum perenne]